MCIAHEYAHEQTKYEGTSEVRPSYLTLNDALQEMCVLKAAVRYSSPTYSVNFK